MPADASTAISSSKPLPRNRRKFATTVTLEPDVIAYLDALQREYDRDRSYLLNALVKDFRRRREATLAPALPTDAALRAASI
jgi:hypothetical protein